MAKPRRSAEEIKDIMSGGEPKWDNKVIDQLSLIKTLTWYSQNKDSKMAFKYVVDYLKKNKISYDEDALGYQPPTFGFLCRIIERGGKLSKDNLTKFNSFIKAIKSSNKEITEQPKSNVISIQDRINEKVSNIAGTLEGSIDDYILSKFKTLPSPFSLMQEQVKTVHASRLIEIFKNSRKELVEALTTDDEQLIEGYSVFSKSELKKLIAYYDLIINDAIKLSDEAKTTRKPRKRKKKTPEQLVSKIKYCQEDKTLKLKSVAPTSIIGANQLWVFNVKTRKLGVYFADDASGLSLKGSTLLNFAEKTSITKTLRKPEQVLPEIIKGGKVYLRNVMGSIKAVEKCLTGRLNSDTILLKIN